MATTQDFQELRKMVDAFAAFVVAKAREFVPRFARVGSALDLEFLEKLFVASRVEYSRDEMLDYANRAPAIVKFKNETGAEFFVASSSNAYLPGPSNTRHPVLMIGFPPPHQEYRS